MNHKVFIAIMCLCFIVAGNALAQVPAGNWTADETIGTATPGSSTLEDGVYSVTGSGADIWGTADAFQYLYRELKGDGSLTAQVIDDGEGTNGWAKGGVMIRESTEPGSVHAMMVMTATDGGGVSFQWRSTTDGSSSGSDGYGSNATEPYWVRIVREGNEFSGWRSPDGEDGTWTQQGSTQTINMPEDVLIGLCVTSHASSESRTFQFDSLSITGGVTPFTSLALASSPSPANGQDDLLRDVTLTWKPGIYAGTHNVYMSENFDDVNDAAASAEKAMGHDVNSLPVGLLDYGKTYYWRVDEVNATSDKTVYPGMVWSFEVEPYSYVLDADRITATASSTADGAYDVNALVDGSGISEDGTTHTSTIPEDPNNRNQWYSNGKMDAAPIVQFDFSKLQVLDKVVVWNRNEQGEAFFPLGAKDIIMETSLDGEEWTVVEGATQLAKASGKMTYNTPDTFLLNDILANHLRIQILSNWSNLIQFGTGLSEVQIYAVPTYARYHLPEDGATDVDPLSLASWRVGRESAQSEVLIDVNESVVADGLVQPIIVNDSEIALLDLDVELGNTYYWRVDEVNNSAVNPVWEGDVLEFTTEDYIVVDDFDSYGNTENSSNLSFDTWVDGYGMEDNGSLSCHDYWSPSSPHFEGDLMESVITLTESDQSLPMTYDGYSHIDRTYDVAQDWTAAGAKTLVLHFFGDPANTGGPLYVEINGKKVTYSNDADLKLPMWFQWNIELASLTKSHAVNSIKVGLESGTGVIYLDNFLLYLDAPEVVEPTPLGDEGLIASYSMENNVKDGSGNGNNGTLVGNATYAQGLSGMALQLDGVDSCVDLGEKDAFNPTGSFSVSVWANIQDWTAEWACVMVGNRGEDGIGWQLRRHVSSSFCFTTRGVGFDDLASQRQAPLDEWVQVVGVYDQENSTKRIYINGSLDIEVATSDDPNETVIAETTHNTYIGARANSANDAQESFFTGMLDDVMLYDRVLTEGEIRYYNGAR